MLQHWLLLRRCSLVYFHLLLASSSISVLRHYIHLRIWILSQMLWSSTMLPLKLRFGTHLTLLDFSLCLPLLLTCICFLFGYIAILWCWSHGLLLYWTKSCLILLGSNVAFTWETVASNFCHDLARQRLLLAEFEEVEVLTCWASKSALVLALSWKWSVLFAGALDVHVSLMTNGA